MELCFGQLTELISYPGLELVGHLPASIQNFTEFSGGVVASSQNIEAGKALLGFLASPAVATLMKTKGLEPRQ